MHPELFRLGSITLYSYGFLILLGVIVGYLYALKNLRKYGLSSEDVSSLFLWCFASVFLGGKLFYFLEEPGIYLKAPSKLLEGLSSGFVFYGSFLLTIPVLIWWFKSKKISIWEGFDVLGISGAFVHGFGKLGCFMAGCCYGLPSGKHFGVVFSNAACSAEPLNTPLFPTQLWDAGIVFLSIALMLWSKKRKWFHGQLFLTYGMFYAVGRFVTERFRGDEERGFVLNGLLSHSQFIAVVVFLVCAALFWLGYTKRRLNT
jgi:phosphatidylglycerol:prolipoprotein diacylglycerol transferase